MEEVVPRLSLQKMYMCVPRRQGGPAFQKMEQSEHKDEARPSEPTSGGVARGIEVW